MRRHERTPGSLQRASHLRDVLAVKVQLRHVRLVQLVQLGLQMLDHQAALRPDGLLDWRRKALSQRARKPAFPWCAAVSWKKGSVLEQESLPSLGVLLSHRSLRRDRASPDGITAAGPNRFERHQERPEPAELTVVDRAAFVVIELREEVHHALDVVRIDLE